MLQKKNRLIHILLLSFFVFTFACTSYKEMAKSDQVIISGVWKEGKDEGKPELYLSIKNENDFAVTVSFRTDYYLNGILEETGEVDNFILEANKTRKGKMNGIILSPSDITWNQINSESFEWEVSELEVEKVGQTQEQHGSR